MNQVNLDTLLKIKALILKSHHGATSFYTLVGDIIKNDLGINEFHISLAASANDKFNLIYISENHRVLDLENSQVDFAKFEFEKLTQYEPQLSYTVDELSKITNNFKASFYSYLAFPIRSKDKTVGNIGFFTNTEDGLSKELSHTINQITEYLSIYFSQKKSEDLLLKQTSRLNALFESSSDLIWSVDSKMEIVSFNQNYFRAIFYKYKGGVVSEYRDSEDTITLPFDEFWESKYKLVFQGNTLHFEVELKHEDNTPVWKEIYLMPIFTADGTVDEISGIARDISDKKKTVDALHQEEEKFKQIFDSIQDLYVRVDLHGRVIMVSPSVLEILGYSPDEVLGMDINDYYLYKVRNKHFFKNLIRKEVLKNIEVSLIAIDGTIIPCTCNIRVIKDHHNKPIAIESVSRDITKIKQTNEALIKSNQSLELSLKAKEQFLANMSHEIRTPLNGIIGLLEVMMQSSISPEQEKYLRTITESSTLLLGILNNILDLSKINAKKLSLQISAFSIKSVIEDIRLLFSAQLTKKNISFSAVYDKKIPALVNSDKLKLQQILSNLISNAIKFTSENGKIRIEAKLINEGHIRITVIDNGIGINEENLSILFKEFTQVSESFSKKFDGVGLGLTIAKELSKLLGGEIGVVSSYGTGSNFWFTFKIKQPVTSIKKSIVKDIPSIEDNIGYNFSRKTILIVDDNKTNRMVASEILKSYSCKIQEANSGKSAVDLVRENKYDVVLMDIQMPVMNGVEAMNKIKQINPMQIVIAMTAYDDNTESNKFTQMGFDNYLIKPITPSSIKNVLTKALQEEKRKEVDIDYDFKTIDKLVQVIGKDILEISLLEFEKDLRTKLMELKSAHKLNNIDKISFNAHSIKGDAATLGLTSLASAASKIENDILNQRFITLDEDLKSLYLICKNIRITIQNIINNYS